MMDEPEPPPLNYLISRQPPAIKDVLRGTVTMVSGDSLDFDAVLLYDISAVRTVERLQSEISKGMGGFSSGIGFIGGLSSVLAWSAILGVAESAVSTSMAAKAKQLFEPYYQALQYCRGTGRFVDLCDIDSIRVPLPAHWRSVTWNSKREVTGGFIFNGDPNVAIRLTDGRITTIFWDKVEQYYVVPVTP